MLAFVDRLTKCAHFISTTSHCSAEERYLRSWEGNPQLEWLVILSFKHIKTTHFLTLLSLKINFWKPASIITYYTQLSMIKLAIFLVGNPTHGIYGPNSVSNCTLSPFLNRNRSPPCPLNHLLQSKVLSGSWVNDADILEALAEVHRNQRS